MPRRASLILDMPTKFLECRAVVHPWKPRVTYEIVVDGRKAYEIHLQCRSCKGWRIDRVYVSDGERTKHIGRRYEPAPGYYLERGVAQRFGGRAVLTRRLRVELFGRYVGKQGRDLVGRAPEGD